MELDRQLQILVDDAAKQGISPLVIERAIAPVLGLFAQQLKHLEYYILQNLDEQWVIFTISDRQQMKSDQNVIYAFPTLKDAADFQVNKDPNILAAALPVTHILFQLLSLKPVDSIVFLEQPGNLNNGTRIERDKLQSLIQQQIQNLNNVPDNLA